MSQNQQRRPGAHLGDIWGHQECLDNLSGRCDVIWGQFLRDGGQDLGVASELLYIRWAGELRVEKKFTLFHASLSCCDCLL